MANALYAIAFASQSYIGLVLITGGVIAQLIGHPIAVTTLPAELANLVELYDLLTGAPTFMMSVMSFIGGLFIDSMPSVLLIVATILPVIDASGYDLIVFEVIVVLPILALSHRQ